MNLFDLKGSLLLFTSYCANSEVSGLNCEIVRETGEPRKLHTLAARSSLAVCPNLFPSQVYWQHHDSILAGHPGITRTFNRIAERYYWPKMDSQIREYVLSCLVCKYSKWQNKIRLSLKPTPPKRPFQLIALDCQGPYTKPDSSRMSVIVAIDYYTRWVELQEIAQQTVENTADFLVNQVFLRHGCPETIYTDRAQKFCSEVMQRDLPEGEWSSPWTSPPQQPTKARAKTLLGEQKNGERIEQSSKSRSTARANSQTTRSSDHLSAYRDRATSLPSETRRSVSTSAS